MSERAHNLHLSRRQLIQGSAAAGLAAAGLAGPHAASAEPASSWAASPPGGFVPLNVPGKVVKVSAAGDLTATMQPNQLFPKLEVARKLLEKAMMEFTGAANLVAAMKKFIHPGDRVAIKVNGIGAQHGYSLGTNYELILPVVEAVIGVGVPAQNVVVYEQYTGFLNGTRANVGKWKLPDGVRADCHGTKIMGTPAIAIYQGIRTKFCKILTDSTAVIDIPLIKDHGICGYTGALKNMSHGNIDNPQSHHAHRASPQIALLYNQPVIRSRVRLHITDGFKMLYDGGPLDRNPRARILHGAVYVSTDPVALDVLGAKLVDEHRTRNRLPTLAAAKREPTYLRIAGELGLGIADLNAIRLKSFEV
ncbi:DUF362 domain-containing protein [Myxococcota bacterium]